MKNTWNKIKSIGVKPTLALADQRQISLTNQFAVIGFLVFVTSGINNLFLGDFFSFLLLECLGMFQMLVFCLNYFSKINIATFVLLTSINLSILYFDLYSGRASGVYLFYFPMTMAIAFLFELNKKSKEFVLHFSITLSFLFFLLFVPHGIDIQRNFSEDTIKQMFGFNLFASIAIIGYFIIVINRSNVQLQKELVEIIDDKNLTENTLKNSLIEKDTLLAEVHHRVKNNLAVVSSLLNLKMDSVTNPYTREVLLECRNRVISMSLIHEKLYRSKSFSNVNFKLYVQELLEEIKQSYPVQNKNIIVDIKSEEILLDLKSAIPCGLLVNELISNSYKHAFKGRTDGLINIFISKKENEVQLIVADNGIGFDNENEERNSLGLILIDSLTEQLDAKGAYIFNEGTKFILSFATTVD